MRVTITAPEAHRISSRWIAASVVVEQQLDQVTASSAQRGVGLVRANASGRPGPRAVTGDYRRSWTARRVGTGEHTIGTNRPQGPRLEYGFHGTDALGRTYNQPPYPHVKPMVDVLAQEFPKAVADVVRRLWGAL